MSVIDFVCLDVFKELDMLGLYLPLIYSYHFGHYSISLIFQNYNHMHNLHFLDGFEPALPSFRKGSKGVWDDEDVEDEDVKESWEDEDPKKVPAFCVRFLSLLLGLLNILYSCKKF